MQLYCQGHGHGQGLPNKTSKGSHPHQEMPGANTEQQDRMAPTGAVPNPERDIERLTMGMGIECEQVWFECGNLCGTEEKKKTKIY